MSNKYFSEYATFRKQEPLASKHSRLSALQTLTITVALWVKLPKPSFYNCQHKAYPCFIFQHSLNYKHRKEWVSFISFRCFTVSI